LILSGEAVASNQLSLLNSGIKNMKLYNA
jgi:hypothetical protein